jgi:translocation and assembly module TamB
MPVAPFLALAGVPAVSTDLRLGGRWNLATGARLNGAVTLARESGDVVLTGGVPIPLHLERLQLEARVVDDAVQCSLDVAGSTLAGRVRLAAASLARNAPLKGDGRFEAATLKLIAPLVGTRAVVDGRAVLTVAAAGTVGAPLVTGNLAATSLRIESPQYGVRLREGILRAELTESSLKLSELTVRGGEGRLTATGTMSRGAQAGTTVDWRAESFQVFDRPDLRLKVDGKGTVGITADHAVVRGALAAREGYFEFEKEGAPKLGNDVVVVGRPRAATAVSGRPRFEAKLLDLDVQLDFGDRMHIVGAGIDTMLGGKLRLQSTRQGLVEAHGTLTGSRGVYYAFGQRLDIERGRLIFDGPPDNPALDILAKRKNLQVEAGVEVTGNVHVPRVQLVSQPPVADSEKLAWLTLGRPLREVTATDAALLQAAASALNSGGNAVPLSRQIANRFGLDDVAVRGGGAPGSQVVALGKRFSDKLYVEYQQGMAATSAMLRLSYVLTRAVSVRLEAGTSSTLGIYFNKSFE